MSALDVLTVDGQPRCFTCVDWSQRPHTHVEGEITIERRTARNGGTVISALVWSAAADVACEYRLYEAISGGLFVERQDFGSEFHGPYALVMRFCDLPRLLDVARGRKAA